MTRMGVERQIAVSAGMEPWLARHGQPNAAPCLPAEVVRISTRATCQLKMDVEHDFNVLLPVKSGHAGSVLHVFQQTA